MIVCFSTNIVISIQEVLQCRHFQYSEKNYLRDISNYVINH